MNDYRVSLQVRNNRILAAIEESGGTFGAKWCVENGLSYGGVLQLVKMTTCPVGENGRLKEAAQGLCDVLCKLPEDLWSEDQMFSFLPKNSASFEMSKDAVTAFFPNEAAKSVELDTSNIENEELKRGLEAAMSTLGARERKVLLLRNESDLTLDNVADVLGVTRERVRQIEGNALRKMRRPERLSQYFGSVDEMLTKYGNNYKQAPVGLQNENQKR